MYLKTLFDDVAGVMSQDGDVKLSGKQDLDLTSVLNIALNNSKVVFEIPEGIKRRNERIILEKFKQIKEGVPIYGTTTSYGGRAGVVLNIGSAEMRLKKATELSESIVHVDVSTGPKIPKEIVRAALLIRMNMLLPGYSGIRTEVLEVLRQMLNEDVTPLVGGYGSVGASGDLAQNGRIVSALLQLPSVKVWNKKGKVDGVRKVLHKLGIQPIKLEAKEGLALVNGDNFSSAACLIVVYETIKLLLLDLSCSALVIQALKGSMRNFHPLISAIRPHPGQAFTADLLIKLLDESKLAKQDLRNPVPLDKDELVQDPYSIRCLPQFFGPDWEALGSIWQTLKININSVSDNPVWTTPEHIVPGEEPYQWVSGGNFMAMNMSESLDRVRKILSHIIKLNDRHLARLVHPKFNKGLPANLSDKDAKSQAVFKGLQTQMGMFDVYSSLLLTPASTAFGTHEEFNQDITSHAPSSAILARELLNVAKLSVSTNLIAVCQAIDLRGGRDLLSPTTKPVYDWVRKQVRYINKAQPLGYLVEKVANNLNANDLAKELFTNLQNGY